MLVAGKSLHTENMPDSHTVLSLKIHHKAADQCSWYASKTD